MFILKYIHHGRHGNRPKTNVSHHFYRIHNLTSTLWFYKRPVWMQLKKNEIFIFKKWFILKSFQTIQKTMANRVGYSFLNTNNDRSLRAK